MSYVKNFTESTFNDVECPETLHSNFESVLSTSRYFCVYLDLYVKTL